MTDDYLIDVLTRARLFTESARKYYDTLSPDALVERDQALVAARHAHGLQTSIERWLSTRLTTAGGRRHGRR